MSLKSYNFFRMQLTCDIKIRQNLITCFRFFVSLLDVDETMKKIKSIWVILFNQNVIRWLNLRFYQSTVNFNALFCTFRQIGFYGIFSISAVLYIIALFYGYFYVEEPKLKIDEKQRLKSAEKSLLADFFDKEHVMETFRVAFKKGENQRGLRVSMLLIVVMVVIGPMHGEVFFNLFRTWSNKFKNLQVKCQLFIFLQDISLTGVKLSSAFSQLMQCWHR